MSKLEYDFLYDWHVKLHQLLKSKKKVSIYITCPTVKMFVFIRPQFDRE